MDSGLEQDFRPAPAADAFEDDQAASAAAGQRLVIEPCSAEQAFAVSSQVPDFAEAADIYGLQEFQRRLENPSGLALVARVDNQPVGFKVGYDRYRDGSWYSWMGGVVPAWRRLGVAQQLLRAQERWVADHGFEMIYVKSRNRHKGMIAFLANHGYDVVRVEQKPEVAEHRVLFSKVLTRMLR